MSIPHPSLNDKSVVCFVLGPSPKYLPSQSYDAYHKVNKRLLLKLRDIFIDLIESKGKRVFLCGLSLGIDFWSCRVLLKLKEIYPFIQVIGIIPYSGLSSSWSPSVKADYDSVLNRLDSFIEVYKLPDYKLNKRTVIEDLVIQNDDGTITIISDGNKYEVSPTTAEKVKRKNDFLVDYSSLGIIVFVDDFLAGTDCSLYACEKGLGNSIYLVNPYSLSVQEGII